MLDILIFDVEHGQSIFFYPHESPEYGMFVDCGNTPEFEPIDFLLEKNFIHLEGQRYVLGNLTITNYDQDHFSGLPYLMTKAHVKTIRFARNLNSQEITSQKPVITDAVKRVCKLQDEYIYPTPNHVPPYQVTTFSLDKSHYPGTIPTTNQLSQIVFVQYAGAVICIAGDIEKKGWEILTKNKSFTDWLGKTNVLIAPHHGRENGYAEEIFDHCFPECVIISDKMIVHGTQEGMTQTYANHVVGDGVIDLNNVAAGKRKTFTTRSDRHIWIQLDAGGKRVYRTFAIK